MTATLARTAGAPPSTWAPLHAALIERHPIAASYHGRLRVICPHALGWRANRAIVLGYQVGGQTSTGSLDPDPRKRWRCLYLDEIDHLVTDHTAAWHTPDNYNPQHPFNAIDELSAAIGNDTTTPGSAR
ncbi:MAG: hypothetical protein H0T70_10855 [Acidimicrobiia bacterium]|nr:hypothetical protein [Acidimicrobiia bacterium]